MSRFRPFSNVISPTGVSGKSASNSASVRPRLADAGGGATAVRIGVRGGTNLDKESAAIAKSVIAAKPDILILKSDRTEEMAGRRRRPAPGEGRVPGVPDCFHGLAARPRSASGQRKEVGLAERVLPSVGQEKKAAVADEPPQTVWACRLTPADERVAGTGFRGSRAEQNSK